MDTPDLAKYGTAIAGFVGAAASLSYMKELTRTQAVIAFATGGMAAIYATPLIMMYFGWHGEAVERGVAFFTGLGAMSAIPAFLALLAKIRDIKLPFSN